MIMFPHSALASYKMSITNALRTSYVLSRDEPS